MSAVVNALGDCVKCRGPLYLSGREVRCVKCGLLHEDHPVAQLWAKEPPLPAPTPAPAIPTELPPDPAARVRELEGRVKTLEAQLAAERAARRS
jgi:hypothetical protein